MDMDTDTDTDMDTDMDRDRDTDMDTDINTDRDTGTGRDADSYIGPLNVEITSKFRSSLAAYQNPLNKFLRDIRPL